MNFYDKPKLIDKHFLKKLISHNKAKKNNSFDKYFKLLKNNFFIILCLLAFAYFLYYRYNYINNKDIEPEIIPEKTTKRINIIPPYFQSTKPNQIVGPETREQTRFIPPNEHYTDPYINQYQNTVPKNNNNPININDYVEENTVNPINLNQNYFYENEDQNIPEMNQYDYSLKTRSASFLTPQYIGPNFSPAN